MDISDKSLCRICLAAGCFNIFNDMLNLDEGSIIIVNALNVFAEKKIEPTDFHPEMICDCCIMGLKQAYSFHLRIVKSEEFLADFGKKYESLVLEAEEQTELIEEQMEKQQEDFHELEIQEEMQMQDGHDHELKEKEDDIIDWDDEQQEYKVEPIYKLPKITLTKTVANILKNVCTSTSTTPMVVNKRKFTEVQKNSVKKRKVDEVHEEKEAVQFVDQTVMVPGYIFVCEDDPHKKFMIVETKNFVATEGNHDEKLLYDRMDEADIFYCKYCPKAFSGPQHLLNHTRKSHLCQHCLQSFPKSSELFKHIKEAHRTFRCTLCHFQTSATCNLRTHMKKMHKIQLPAHVSLIQVPLETDVEEIKVEENTYKH